MLNTLTIKAEPISETSKELKTPITYRAVRRFRVMHSASSHGSVLSWGQGCQTTR